MTTSSAQILLVEDDGDIRESIREVLEDEGYTVAEAPDGVEALSLLRTAEPLPRLILLDLMMPRMNGVQFRHEMIKVPALRDIPVLILSADADMRRKAEGLAAAGCLEKPIELSVLLETVARALGHGDALDA